MMERFQIVDTTLPGLKVVKRILVSDARGWLERIFCARELAPAGWDKKIDQINHTHTVKKGTVRGMHYQKPPHAEIKLVSCLQGEVFDVAVDIRTGSPTFLQWYGELLSDGNHTAMLIPEGFAHGFQTLSDQAEILYLSSAPYEPGAEGGLHPQDPNLDITWPLPVDNLSERDAGHPYVSGGYQGVAL